MWRTLAVAAVAFFVVYVFTCVVRRGAKMRSAPRVPLEAYVDRARTGDILMFRHKDTNPVHDVASPYSHVGIAVRHPVLGTTHVLETHGAGDAVRLGVKTGGVHLHDLRARLQEYEGDVWVYAVNKEPQPSKVMSVLSDRVLFSVPFDSNYVWSYLTCDAGEAMFCAQFAATVLARFGIVSEDHPTCLTPLDVLHLPFAKEFEYAPVQKICVRKK